MLETMEGKINVGLSVPVLTSIHQSEPAAGKRLNTCSTKLQACTYPCRGVVEFPPLSCGVVTPFEVEVVSLHRCLLGVRSQCQPTAAPSSAILVSYKVIRQGYRSISSSFYYSASEAWEHKEAVLQGALLRRLGDFWPRPL